jgi:glycosyltransferase involved in cell wall biosynthesis
MRPPRLSILLPRPTGFYRGLLPQMQRGFEQAGFEVSGTTDSLNEAQLVEWCRTHKTEIVFDMNRTRSQLPLLPRSVVHVSWIVDFLGRTEPQIQGSELTYFFTTGWVKDFPYDSFCDWLPPGSCPETYAPSGAPFASDVSVAGHVPPPWSEAELERNVSRRERSLSFRELLRQFEAFLASLPRDNDANHATLWEEVNRIVRAATGDGIIDDPAIRYDLLGRLPRSGLRQTMVSEVLQAGHSLRIFGTRGWAAWPELAPHYRGFLETPAELASAYASSRINLHEGEGMHFRSVDCLAAGGLLFYCARNKSTDPRGGWHWAAPDARVNDRTQALVAGEHYVEYYPGELAEKARYYLARPDLCDQLRRNARAVISQHHTWRHRALKIADDLRAIGIGRVLRDVG